MKFTNKFAVTTSLLSVVFLSSFSPSFAVKPQSTDRVEEKKPALPTTKKTNRKLFEEKSENKTTQTTMEWINEQNDNLKKEFFSRYMPAKNEKTE